MNWTTADLCDRFGEELEIVDAPWRDFGGSLAFEGAITTLLAPEDNSLVRSILSEPGAGRVLVVDGNASARCALLGDQLAQLAVDNGWAGVLVNGRVRDSAVLARLPLGVKALGTHPRKTLKRNLGDRDVVLRLGGVRVSPGAYLFADGDGVLVAPRRLV